MYFALQIALLHGAEVIVTSSSDEKLERLGRGVWLGPAARFRLEVDEHSERGPRYVGFAAAQGRHPERAEGAALLEPAGQ